MGVDFWMCDYGMGKLIMEIVMFDCFDVVIVCDVNFNREIVFGDC